MKRLEFELHGRSHLNSIRVDGEELQYVKRFSIDVDPNHPLTRVVLEYWPSLPTSENIESPLVLDGYMLDPGDENERRAVGLALLEWLDKAPGPIPISARLQADEPSAQAWQQSYEQWTFQARRHAWELLGES